MMRFGIHPFVAAIFVNIWFLVATHSPTAFEASGFRRPAWSQSLAWLDRHRPHGSHSPSRMAHPAPPPGGFTLSGDPQRHAPKKLTPPLVLFAVIRAIAIGSRRDRVRA